MVRFNSISKQLYVRISLVLLLILQLQISLSGQCPDRDSLLSRIHDRKSNRTPAALQRFLSDEAKSSGCYSGGDTVMMKLYESISIGYHSQSNFPEGAKYIRKAIAQLYKPALNIPDWLKRLAKYYYFLTVFYDSLGDKGLQMESIDSCLAVEKRDNRDYKFSTYLISYKVNWLYNRGDFKQCIIYSDFGETLVQQNLQGADSTKYLLYILTYKAQSLLNIGDSVAAETLVQKRIRDGVNKGAKVSLGVMYSLAGLVYRYNMKFDEALRSYHEAYSANKKLGYLKGCAESLTNIAIILNDNFNKPDSALWYLKLGLTYSDGVDSLVAFDMMGNVMVKKKNFKQAFEFFGHSLNQLAKGMHIKDLLTVTLDKNSIEKTTEYITTMAIHYGNAYISEFKVRGNLASLDKAIEIFSITDKFLSKSKQEHFELETKLFWRGFSRRLYESAIEACYLRADNENAFQFFERSRAVLLSDDLQIERLISEKDMGRQAELQLENIGLRQQLSAMKDGSKGYQDIQQKIYYNTIQKDSLDRKIKSYTSSHPAENPLPEINSVRSKILPNHNALIELFVGDSSVYVFSILKKGSTFSRIDKEHYLKLSNALLTSLSKPSLYENDFEKFTTTSHELYKLIFGSTQIPPGRIIISPDGNHFPFEALITSDDKKNIRYMLNDYAVSYSYSAGYLVNNKAQTFSQSKIFMGVAPVNYNPSLKLTALLGSDYSLETISNQFDQPSTFYSSAANRHNFLDNFYKYKIIHLYSHASANAETGNPVLFFADSALYLNDLVLRDRPVTSLVVLAACESGRGKFYSGEGVFSFNRAFASLGIPTALVNLWPVDNKTTYELSEIFYENLSAGMDLDVALQQAKLKYLASASGEKQLPYYWAPGVITGRSESILLNIQRKYDRWLFMIFAFVTIILAGSLLWARRIANSG